MLNDKYFKKLTEIRNQTDRRFEEIVESNYRIFIIETLYKFDKMKPDFKLADVISQLISSNLFSYELDIKSYENSNVEEIMEKIDKILLKKQYNHNDYIQLISLIFMFRDNFIKLDEGKKNENE